MSSAPPVNRTWSLNPIWCEFPVGMHSVCLYRRERIECHSYWISIDFLDIRTEIHVHPFFPLLVVFRTHTHTHTFMLFWTLSVVNFAYRWIHWQYIYFNWSTKVFTFDAAAECFGRITSNHHTTGMESTWIVGYWSDRLWQLLVQFMQQTYIVKVFFLLSIFQLLW